MGLLSILLVGSGLFFADQEKGRFERKAASDILAQMVEGKGKVEVRVEPTLLGGLTGELHSATIRGSEFQLDEMPLFLEPERSKSGKIGELRLDLKDFQLRKLRVSELQATIPGCRYDYGLAKSKSQIRVSQTGEGDGFVKLLEKDLADYLVAKYHEIKSCKVKLHGDTVWVEGYGEFLIVNSNFAVIGQVRIVDGTKLMLDNPSIYFDWVKADPLATQGLLKILNPIVDLERDLGLANAVSVNKVKMKDGVLTASGKTRIPTRPSDDSVTEVRK
jgi:hypothetical protein